jgi:hypothetical protein
LGLALLAILVIASEYTRTLPRDWLWDFGSFVESGRAAKQGLDPFGIYPLTFHVVLPGFESWNPNLNPPVSALLFQLFDLADPHRMFRIWYGISIALYALTVLLLTVRFSALPRPIFLLWAFALAGFWDTLLLGQIYIPLVLAGVAAWLLLERGQAFWAGLLIGCVVALKPNFAVWPVLLFLSGHMRPALWALLTAAVISAIPAVVLGPQVYGQWIELLASDEERAFFLTNASLPACSQGSAPPRSAWRSAPALLLAAAAWAFRVRPSVTRVGAIALTLSLLASPIAWVHYTLFLLPVLLSRWDLNGMRVVALLLIVPVSFVVSQFGRAAWIQVTVGSVYNWAIILCLCVLIADEVARFRDPARAAGADGSSGTGLRAPGSSAAEPLPAAANTAG